MSAVAQPLIDPADFRREYSFGIDKGIGQFVRRNARQPEQRTGLKLYLKDQDVAAVGSTAAESRSGLCRHRPGPCTGATRRW
ncbi:hypothetical protein [Nibrella viscosa]|uniref:hypothetical protein n=1 Tax=Nibrella viscosa TaxID=1084524 RepID=UPI0031E6C0E2